MLGPALVLARLLVDKRKLGWRLAAAGWLCALGVLAAFQVPTWKNSETLARHTIAASPESWIGHNNLAVLLEEKGRYQEAADLCRKAVRLCPEYAHAHTNLGLSLIAMDKVEEGVEHLNKGIRLNPRMSAYVGPAAETKLASGMGYEAKGDLVRAAAEYRKALHIKPEYFDATFRLGVCLKNDNRLDEAADQFTQALKLKPGDARTRFNLGLVFAMRKDVELAIKHYREAVRLDPAYAPAHNNLGLLYEERGDLVQAVAHYEKAVEHAPRMPQAQANLRRAKDKQMRADGNGQRP